MFECFEEFADFLSKRIAKLRTQRNLSARDMSLSIGQGPAYVNNIENNKSMPSMKGFYYICEFFKISPKDFFDEGAENPLLLQEAIDGLRTLNDNDLTLILGNIKRLQGK